VMFGYTIDYWGLGIGRIDDAVERIAASVRRGGFATTSVATSGPSIPAGAAHGEPAEHRSDSRPSQSLPSNLPLVDDSGRERRASVPPSTEPRPEFDPDDSSSADSRPSTTTPPAANPSTSILTPISHGVHLLWWVVAVAGLVAGVMYLTRGAPEVALEVAPTFFGLFTVAGLLGTALSFYLYFVGRHYMDEAASDRARERFGSAYETFQHAAMETSMVTVWVIAGYLLYEYTMGVFSLDIKALAAAVGVFAPMAGAALGLVPGCTPQIIFAQLYAVEEVIPFSALVANAISQDGDALFPLMAIDMKAAVIATIYTTIPACIVGALVFYFWPFARFGFGVLS